MNDFVIEELDRLKRNYREVTGRDFSYFFCPILFKDEKTELCQAHIINKAFSNSDRVSTIQRSDIDNTYGSKFESDFIDISKYQDKNLTDIISDPLTSKRFNTRILLNGRNIQHFYSSKNTTNNFTKIFIGDRNASKSLFIKMHPSAVSKSSDENWELDISRDLRLPMLVSSIKAAHLSMFKMLGYQYALSASGRYIGRSILGEFFLKYGALPKREIGLPALKFFRPFSRLVRPVISPSIDFRGTVSDNNLFLCIGSSGTPWAFLVFVRTNENVTCVMLPTLQSPTQYDAFFGFMENSNESIQVSKCHFAGDKWEVSEDTQLLKWPKSGIFL